LDYERTTNKLSDDTKTFALVETRTGENPVMRYQYDNHLGSACLELDANANIISYEEYHPFGTTSYRAGRSYAETSLKRYKYCGKERDEETGLYYYGARYYAGWLCRFVSVDPLQHEYPHYTPYQYAGNMPITYIDLDGLEPGVRFENKLTNRIIEESFKPKKDNDSTMTDTHKDIIETSAKWTYDESIVEWTSFDIIKWKAGEHDYIFERKSEFVSYYRHVIEDAAKKFDIPEFLLAGIAFTEFGGDPTWIDDIAEFVRSFDWSGPEWIDKNLTITSHPDKTSMGNLSIQIRTAAESLGYEYKNLSSQDRKNIITSLKNPIQNIYIAAKHLSDLRYVDFNGKTSSQLTEDDIKVIATRYNRGSGISLENIKKNLSYGNSIYKHASKILSALK
jgi:RHS repeat-associated protein